jgi:hypothetical protein
LYRGPANVITAAVVSLSSVKDIDEVPVPFEGEPVNLIVQFLGSIPLLIKLRCALITYISSSLPLAIALSDAGDDIVNPPV